MGAFGSFGSITAAEKRTERYLPTSKALLFNHNTYQNIRKHKLSLFPSALPANYCADGTGILHGDLHISGNNA